MKKHYGNFFDPYLRTHSKITLVIFIFFILAGGCTQNKSQVGVIDHNLQKQRTKSRLKIAFIHLNVRHKNLEINRQNIIELNRKAAG